jgi:hypothetical protein
MGKNVRNNFLEPRASAGETGRRELLYLVPSAFQARQSVLVNACFSQAIDQLVHLVYRCETYLIHRNFFKAPGELRFF